jgi:hypothetical protein
MEETVKFISGIVHCPCKKEGSQHAHIHRVKDLPKMPSKNLNVNDGRYIQICFVFECGHTRTDHYRFYKGTTYCETQHIFDDRDCPFQVVAPRRFFNKIEMEDSKAEDGSSI